LSPDGQTLATVGDDHLIRIWNVKDGRRSAKLAGHRRWVRCAAFSPDGQTLITAGDDRKVMIWDAATYQLKRELQGQLQAYGLAYSPKGERIAVVGFANQLRFYDPQGQPAGELACACRDMRAVAFSPDGARLASGASGPTDNSVLVWDVSQVTAVATLAAEKIDAAALEQLWKELADKDARIAHQAIGSLRQVPDKALPLLTERLEPILGATDTEEILKLIKQLDDDKFALREGATNQLRKLRPAADALLQKTLAEGPSAEARARIKTILGSPLPTNTVDPAEQLRAQRIVYLLKLTGTKAAKALLERISTNFPDQQVSRQAVAALAAMGGE